MDEVDVEAVDSGLEVVERVQLRLLLAPVVLGQPVVAHDLHMGHNMARLDVAVLGAKWQVGKRSHEICVARHL